MALEAEFLMLNNVEHVRIKNGFSPGHIILRPSTEEDRTRFAFQYKAFKGAKTAEVKPKPEGHSSLLFWRKK